VNVADRLLKYKSRVSVLSTFKHGSNHYVLVSSESTYHDSLAWQKRDLVGHRRNFEERQVHGFSFCFALQGV